jgi:hypothetical protein
MKHACIFCEKLYFDFVSFTNSYYKKLFSNKFNATTLKKFTISFQIIKTSSLYRALSTSAAQNSYDENC